MAVNIHITIIELNALHTKRQNLFQELDAVIHLLMRSEERFSRNAETDLVCRLLLEKKKMAAFCMAVYFRGLSRPETFALTDAMIRSGETIDLGAALGRKVVFFF